MRADHARGTRRVRALAVVAILLTTLAALSPALAQTGGHAAQHLHALKASGYTTIDQGSSTVRIDQPAVTVHPASVADTVRTVSDSVDAGTNPDQFTAETPTSRGPPGGP